MAHKESAESLHYYNANAITLARTYESVTFEDVHQDVLDLLPKLPARVLDVGAGSGRDAAALAFRGFQVVAVEPSAKLLSEARTLHPDASIEWIDDSLPNLRKLKHVQFDLILVSAVWMHIVPGHWLRAMKRLHELLCEDGLLILTIREGPPEKGRMAFSIDSSDLEREAFKVGFDLVRRARRPDAIGRSGIYWITLALSRRLVPAIPTSASSKRKPTGRSPKVR